MRIDNESEIQDRISEKLLTESKQEREARPVKLKKADQELIDQVKSLFNIKPDSNEVVTTLQLVIKRDVSTEVFEHNPIGIARKYVADMKNASLRNFEEARRYLNMLEKLQEQKNDSR